MTKFISLLSLLISFSLFSQSYYQVNQTYFQQNNVSVSNNLGLYSIANSLRGFRNAWENENQKRRAINKYEAELNIIKKVYSEKEELPEKIVDGWHDVKVTDNYHYCSDAKVLVENNEIVKFVIDNYSEYSLNFNSIGQISSGKCYLNLELPNGNKDTVEVYFLYDLDSPTIVEAPVEAGYITFWSDHRKASTIEIWINEKRQGQIQEKIDKEKIECFENGSFSLKLKPGIYNYRAEANGALGWLGKIEIKEGGCFTLLLNRDNKD